uniref:hypothetical protein n=1 Tax=Pantoea sp. GbtcB22 TaxID=2824767 RepID=UPI001C310A1F
GSFSDCLIGNTLVNGDVENANDVPLLSIEIGDVRTEETISLEGSNGPALHGVNLEGGGIIPRCAGRDTAAETARRRR